MPYRAQRPSLFGQMGAPDAPTTQIDVAGAIDALTSGTQGIIHQAMLRRQAENARAQFDEQQQYSRGRDKIEDKRHDEEVARQTQKDADELKLRQLEERHRFIEQGGIPEHTEFTPTPAMASVAAPVARSPIQGAMMPGQPQFTPTGVPNTAGARSPLPASTLVQSTVPEHYDPTQAAAYVRQVAVEGAREQFNSEQQKQRLVAQQQGRVFAANAAHELAKFRADLAVKAKGSTITRAMTGNAMEQAAQKTAEGLLEQFNGSYDDAYDFLTNTKEGKALADFGVQPRHLTAARGKYVRDASGQAIRLQSGAMGAEPAEAVNAVQTTRQLVGGMGGGRRASATTTDNTKATAKSGEKAGALKVAPDSVLDELDRQFNGDEKKIRAELKKRGYRDDM